MSRATHDLITLHRVLHATLHTTPPESGFCGSKLHILIFHLKMRKIAEALGPRMVRGGSPLNYCRFDGLPFASL